MARPSSRTGGLRSSIDELLARCTFPAAGAELHCAVSGGADSSALVILATKAGCAVTAHHVEHGIRPDSVGEADLVAALARDLGARFVSHQVHVEPGPNLEARARAARFAVLPPGVATGHTLDDRAETILLNLMRGAARRGLTPLRDPQRHPIVRLRRRETEAVCHDIGLTYLHDLSNDDPMFLRNRVRHEALPLLVEISDRDVAAVLDRQADVMAAEDDLLEELAATIDPTDAKAVAAAHPALARRALRRFITDGWDRDHPPSARSIDRVLTVACGSAIACEIEGGHRVHRSAQKLRLEPPIGSVTLP